MKKQTNLKLGLQKRISFLIPVYNTSKEELKGCLESVLNCCRGEDEIIIVDDGSQNPDTLNALRFYESKYSTAVRIIRQKNSGQAVSRNVAAKASNNPYILFVDSDDELIPEAFERLRKCINTIDFDLFLFDVEIINEQSGASECRKGFHTLNSRITKKDYFFDLFCGKTPDALWGKIYRKDLFLSEDLKHLSNMRVGEDTLALYKIAAKAERISYFSETCYRYFLRKNSISHNVSINHIDDLIILFDEATKILVSAQDKALYEDYCSSRAPNIRIIIAAYLAPQRKRDFRDVSSRIKRADVYVRSVLNKKRRYNWKERILLFCFKHQLFFYAIHSFLRTRGI